MKANELYEITEKLSKKLNQSALIQIQLWHFNFSGKQIYYMLSLVNDDHCCEYQRNFTSLDELMQEANRLIKDGL